jgi:hypothetical protein
MRRLLIAAALSLPLAGCGGGESPSDDPLARTCMTISTAELAFNVFASTQNVRQSTVDAVRKAVAAAQAVCNGPRPTNPQAALLAAQRALQAVADETRRARSG